MRIMLVGGGVRWSIYDVQTGYHDALLRAGHDVGLFALDKRLEYASTFLRWRWEQRGSLETEKPTTAHVEGLAGDGILSMALTGLPPYDRPVDWVLAISGMFLHPDWLILLKRAGVRTAVLLTESPYDDDCGQDGIASLADVVFTNERTSVDALRRYNRYNTHYLAPAYDPARHHPFRPAEFHVGEWTGVLDGPWTPAHDVVMVGTGWQERCDMLAGVDWTGVDLGLYGTWELLPDHMRQYVKDGITANDVTTALYRRAKIGLNLYRTTIGALAADARHIEHAESMNPRALELAAAGCFTLSDYRAEVAEVFGNAVPTFSRPAELQQLVRYYLSHDDERQALAQRLPGLVVGHTYDARVQTLMQVLEDF